LFETLLQINNNSPLPKNSFNEICFRRFPRQSCCRPCAGGEVGVGEGKGQQGHFKQIVSLQLGWCGHRTIYLAQLIREELQPMQKFLDKSAAVTAR
jgi:hypothetical protein